MDEWQVVGIVTALVILIAVMVLEMRRWLPARGEFKFALVSLSGIGIVGVLYATGIPPEWFAGDKEGFGLAVLLLLSGFFAEREAGRTFGLPLLLGMGLTLVVLNVLAHL